MMSIHEIVFKCYTIKKKKVYVSGCINLNLLCTGNTIEESKNNIIGLINDYLEITIAGKRLKEAKHLLNRKAPISMYFDYFKCFIVSKLFGFSSRLKRNLLAFKEVLDGTFNDIKLQPNN